MSDTHGSVPSSTRTPGNRKRLVRQLSSPTVDDRDLGDRGNLPGTSADVGAGGGGGGAADNHLCKRSRLSATRVAASDCRDTAAAAAAAADRNSTADEPRRQSRTQNGSRARHGKTIDVGLASADRGERKSDAPPAPSPPPPSTKSGKEDRQQAEEPIDWTRVGAEKTRELRLIVTRAVYCDENEAQRRARLDRLPGPLPATLRRAHLATLDPTDYWLCEKSDGERMMLLVTRTDVWLVDRRFRFVHVQTRRGGAELVSVLVDGELVRNLAPSSSSSSSSSSTYSSSPPPPPHDRWKNYSYLAFDILVASDRNLVVDTPFRSRIDEMARALERPAPETVHASVPPRPPSSSSSSSSSFVASPLPPPLIPPPPELALSVKCKKFVRLVDAAYSFSKISRDDDGRHVFEDGKRDMRHLNDGVVLTPNLGGYLCLDQRAPLLKWKWPGMHTLEFRIRRPFFDGQGMLQLWAGGPKGADVMVRKTAISQYERAALLQELSGACGTDGGGDGGGDADSEEDARDGDRTRGRGGDGSDSTPIGSRRRRTATDASAVVECAYEPQSSRWRVKGRRRDKSEPNFITTVIATLETIVDHVTRDELIRFGQPRPQHPMQPRPGAAAAVATVAAN